jgi:hypothetical protein
MKKYLLILLLALFAYSVNADVCIEGERQSCGYSDIGECRYGTQICENGEWSVCLGGKGPELEVCDDGKDNDCDGFVDEDCECQTGEVRECGVSDVGICEFGVEECVDNLWNGCVDAILPEIADFCDNGVDDDCDGEVNEGCLEFPEHCYNDLWDENEDGIDCGRSCGVCETCDDGVKNQDEEGIDCGGVCEDCHSCFDGIKNGDEEDIDCGGECRECVGIGDTDADGDGVKYSKELLMGTDPGNEDSDFDGVKDGQDRMPLCPNGFCDVRFGEDEKSCREDCKEGGNALFVSVVVGLLILIIGFYLYVKFRKSTKEMESNGKVVGRSEGFDIGSYQSLNRRSGKVLDTELEKKLKKSLEKTKKVLEK